MSNLELILYTLLFAGISFALAIPALRWYKMNAGMTLKKKVSIIVLVAAVVLIAGVVISNFLE